ncbi:MAG: hypothetical protein MUC29_09875 [Pyrinomonadaceae bacterium]|jgi:hypothetical protein|nr:hypothetical protein [Pyrinomonadaceae bacterium]
MIRSVKLLMLVLLVVNFGFAQKSETENPTMVFNKSNKTQTVASGNNLYCAGFIQTAQVNTNLEIVGGQEEQEKYNYVSGDYVYINAGTSQGVKVGDEYSVIRPKGKFKTALSSKGSLGIFVQEVGSLEVVNVKEQVSVAVIRNSCEAMYLGDLLQPTQKRVSPTVKQNATFNQFSDTNGKATGKIVMARDGQEMVTRDQIVYVDLGAEDNIKVGDYLTVYRKLGKGNIQNHIQDESIPARNSGYQSENYKGGPFSNVSGRKAGENAEGQVVTTSQAKSRRPNNLRKVVGEMVILNVKEKTATAVITRTLQEIHTGDMVEVQ